MIDIILKYQANLFANLDVISPNTDVIAKLLEIYRDKGLIPSIMQEYKLGVAGIVPRIIMAGVNGEWKVTIGSTRLQIDKSATNVKGSNFGTLSDFCRDSVELFVPIIETFKITSNRLSLITGYLLEEMTQDTLNDVYHRFFIPTPFYDRHAPFEWNWRAATKYNLEFSGLNETLNLINTTKRSHGEITSPEGTIPFDRIQVELDINTQAETKEYRFAPTSIRGFFDSAVGVHETLLDDALGVIYA